MTQQSYPDRRQVLVVGVVVFAATMMIMVGAFQVIAGLIIAIDVAVIWALSGYGRREAERIGMAS